MRSFIVHRISNIVLRKRLKVKGWRQCLKPQGAKRRSSSLFRYELLRSLRLPSSILNPKFLIPSLPSATFTPVEAFSSPEEVPGHLPDPWNSNPLWRFSVNWSAIVSPDSLPVIILHPDITVANKTREMYFHLDASQFTSGQIGRASCRERV